MEYIHPTNEKSISKHLNVVGAYPSLCCNFILFLLLHYSLQSTIKFTKTTKISRRVAISCHVHFFFVPTKARRIAEYCIHKGDMVYVFIFFSKIFHVFSFETLQIIWSSGSHEKKIVEFFHSHRNFIILRNK